MSYAPNNTSVYLAAMAGAISGLRAAGNYLNDANAANYSLPAASADAFAQEVDIVWANNPATQLELSIIENASADVWITHSPLRTDLALTPGNYFGLAGSVVALAQQGNTQVTNQGVNPNGPVASTYVQSKFAEITGDVSTSSITFVDLLTVNITTGANILIVTFTSASMNNTPNRTNMFRLVIDSTAIRATSIDAPAANDFESGALVYRTSVTAGAHVVKIQWQVDAGTANIQPVTAPNESHASLLVQEVTV